MQRKVIANGNLLIVIWFHEFIILFVLRRHEAQGPVCQENGKND
jgi:hypothetical protein